MSSRWWSGPGRRRPLNPNLRVLREEGRFRVLLLAGFVSGVGNWFNTVAVLSLALTITHSGFAVGATLAVQVLPRLIAGPVAGVLADRLSRKAILIVTDLASAALALSFLFVTSPGRIWLIYAGSAALVVSSALHTPARTAAIPSLVSERNLLTANALNQTVSGSVMVVGSVLGGVASGAFGPRVAFIVNALSFLVSVLLTAPLHFPSVGQRARKGLAGLGEFWPVLWGTPILRVEYLLAVLWALGGGAINVLVSVYAIQVFHAGNAGIGVLYGALGLGLVAGGLLAHTVSRWVREAAGLCVVLEGAAHMGVSRAPTLWLAALLLAIAATAAGVGNACGSYIVMRAVERHFLGRAFALISTISSTVMAGSMLLPGVLLRTSPPHELGVAAGGLIVAAGVVGGILLMRSPLPQEEDTQAAIEEQSAVAVS